MSVNLFTLAMKKINENEWYSKIWLESGPTIDKVSYMGVVKGQPSLAYASVESRLDGEQLSTVYFQIKDLIAFLAEEDEGSETNEPEED